jgi:hypothetical protein
MERIAEASPRFKSRIAAVLYLIIGSRCAAATCRPAAAHMTVQTQTLKGFVWFTVNLERPDGLAPYSGSRRGASE